MAGVVEIFDTINLKVHKGNLTLYSGTDIPSSSFIPMTAKLGASKQRKTSVPLGCSDRLPYMTPSAKSSKLVRTIPTEIWINIFLLALENSISLKNPFSPIFAELHTLLDLALVCRNWREIILNNSRFWTTVYISVSKSDTEKARHVEFLENWVRRAVHLPLTLKIKERDSLVASSEPEESLAHIAICDFIQKYSARWRKLDIHFSPVLAHNCSAKVLNLGEFPELCSLTLRAANQYGQLRVSISAPRLHQIQTTGRVIVVNNHSHSAPYRKATIHEQTILEFVKMFTFTEVEEIVYTNSEEPGVYASAFVHVPVTLTRLSSFTAYLGSPGNCRWLLNHMCCPALDTLDLTLGVGIGSGPHLASIGAFIAQRAQKLRVLKLSCFDVNEGDLMDMLKIGRHCLEEFRLTNRGSSSSNAFISNATLKRLKLDSRQTCILKNLLVFFYKGRTKGLDLRHIAETLGSRILQEFTLILNPIDEVAEDQASLDQIKHLAHQNQVSCLHLEVHKKVIVSSKSNK